VISERELFIDSHVIRWPEKYRPVVDFLINGSEDKPNDNSLFERNVHVVCFAAGLGIKISRRESISGEKLLEIETDTFINNNLGIWIFLISLMSNDEPDITIFRTSEGESEAVKQFQEYAAGGLAFLNERLNEDSVQTPFMFVRKILDSFATQGDEGSVTEVEIDFGES
jgi:dnd system-associated protein 4